MSVELYRSAGRREEGADARHRRPAVGRDRNEGEVPRAARTGRRRPSDDRVVDPERGRLVVHVPADGLSSKEVARSAFFILSPPPGRSMAGPISVFRRIGRNLCAGCVLQPSEIAKLARCPYFKNRL